MCWIYSLFGENCYFNNIEDSIPWMWYISSFFLVFKIYSLPCFFYSFQYRGLVYFGYIFSKYSIFCANVNRDFFNCLLNLSIFNWKIIALQCCVGFCHTATWISHNYTYVPFFLNLPLTPYTSHPSRAPGIHRAVDWTLCIIHQLSTSYL